jgi:hypothetical membrane protein
MPAIANSLPGSGPTRPSQHPEPAPLAPGRSPKARDRAAGATLVAGAVIFFLAEFIAAAAWTDPPYSYSYHYISNLGVRGPVAALQQYMYSPLAWVMNTGFFLFGITVFVGGVLLTGLSGWRRSVVLTLTTLVAVGSVLLAFFHGDGTVSSVDYHSLGALASIGGGNVLLIALGRLHLRIGVAARQGKAMIVLGVFGLLSLVGFLVLAGSGVNVLIGLVERCAVYPILIGLICAGVSIRRRQTLHTSPQVLG